MPSGKKFLTMNSSRHINTELCLHVVMGLRGVCFHEYSLIRLTIPKSMFVAIRLDGGLMLTHNGKQGSDSEHT